MKILIVHPDDPSHEHTWSGTPYFIINTFKDKSITVNTFAVGPTSKMWYYFFKIVQYSTHLDYHYSLAFRFFSAVKLKWAIRKFSPDVILHMGTSSAITFLKTQVPNFLYTDSTWHIYTKYCLNFMNPQPSSNKIQFINNLHKKDLLKFESIFVLSEFCRSDIIEHYGLNQNKIHFVGGGIGNVAPYYGEKDFSKKQLFFLARHSFKRKGGELMLDAVRILQKTMPNIKVIICGGAEINVNYLDIKNLVVLGNICRKELQALFESSSLLVMPSIFEPFGLVYLEAMVNKTPVVGLARGALPDITDEGRYGFLLDKEDPKLIAEQILLAFSDIENLKEKANSGQQFILNNFTWENVVEKFLTVMAHSANIVN